MNNDNKTTRELALEWWEELDNHGKVDAISIHLNTIMPHAYKIWNDCQGQITDEKIMEIYFSQHPQTETKKEEGKEGDILEGNKGAKWYLIPAYFKPFRGFSEIVIAEMGIDVTTKLESENKSLREANQRLKEGLQEVIDFLHVLPMLRLANKQGFDECINIEGVKELEAKAKQVLNQ